ncbi:ABC transporter permease [Alterisphingorhabdus coralli]|uniref:ABC transporter permease subunit n=1 Tax=Alterisphingorhabdus coralli TaxID=3071408 RepID=A0AA97F7H1_9SPHN|nr:ABC transporter permease subunit [Parasphingorhabdus sp. SCSIO 66989]WOE75824.1 ABC transporter permease subunit [Parasphingorhabdus sp. SCSIO 66989]
MRIAIILVAMIVVFAVLAPMLSPWDHASIDWDHVSAVAGVNSHILGTDDVGRDVLARLAVATRITLAVALTAALVSLVIGVVWGALAGWIGGRTDELMMRIVDGLFALPFMFVVIILMVVFGRSIILVFVGIGLVEWLTMARIVRGQVLALKNRPYVLAARAAGAPAITILARHILPNIAGIAFAYLVLTLPQLVMIESFLSFLGLGVQEPLVSLGMLIKDGAEVMDIQPMALLLPGGIMVTLLVALTLIGDRLRDRFA